MREPIMIAPGAGEVVGDSPDRRVEILADDDALAATWSRFGPRREGADPHVHRRHSDLFYVLAGELTVMLGPERREVVVPAGTLAMIPPLVVHGFRNGRDAELRYLNFHAPGEGFADYLRALRDGRTTSYDQEPPPADGGRPVTEAVIGGDGLRTDRIKLLVDVDAIGISEELWENPRRPPHVHHRHVESFYVLEGELGLIAGGRELRAPAGAWLRVPPGVRHSVRSASEHVRLLNLHTPSCGFGAHVRALDSGGRTDFDQL